MKRIALLVFVGVTIGVTSVVGIVWLHEVGWRQLFGDRNEVAKKPGTVILEAGSVIRSTPAVTFVQNPSASIGEGRRNYKGPTDTFGEEPVEAKAVPSKAVRTPPTRSDDPFGDPNSLQDSMTVSQTKTPVTDDDSFDSEPKSSGAALGSRTSQNVIRRMVPKTHTITEYVETKQPDGTTHTAPVQRQVTVYEEEVKVISPEEQGEIAAFRKAVEAMKSAKEEAERTKATEELRGLMHKYFQRDMQRREKDLLEAEGRVKKLREQFDKRKGAETEIVNLRLQMMINEATGLGFSLPFDEGNPAATSSSAHPAVVPYGSFSQGGMPRMPIPSYVQPTIDGPGPGVAPSQPRRNREKDKGSTFEPRSESSGDPAPAWKPDSKPQPAADDEEPLPNPSVSEPLPTKDSLIDPVAKPETFEEKPAQDKDNGDVPNPSQGSKPDLTSELDAIEGEVNRSLEELWSKQKTSDPLQLESEQDAKNLLRTEVRVDVLIKNLASPNEARSIVAAKELGQIGKEARNALLELETLMKKERNEKGFPSVKQREAFLEAFVKIHAAIKAKDGEKPKSIEEPGAA